jgi:hypothetical protein
MKVFDKQGSLVVDYGLHASEHEAGGSDEVSLGALSGEITDAQHGVRTQANAHAHSHLSGIGADDHHNRQHDHSLAADGSPIALAGVPNLPASRITSERFGMARMPDGTDTYRLKAKGAGNDPAYEEETISITFIIDGGGTAITAGSKGYLEIPFACTISGWTILADQSGSIVVDVKKCTYAGFPTTSSIAGSEKPTLSSAQKNQDLSLTTWTPAIAAGDILEFVVDSAATVQRVTVALRARKS